MSKYAPSSPDRERIVTSLVEQMPDVSRPDRLAVAAELFARALAIGPRDVGELRRLAERMNDERRGTERALGIASLPREFGATTPWDEARVVVFAAEELGINISDPEKYAALELRVRRAIGLLDPTTRKYVSALLDGESFRVLAVRYDSNTTKMFRACTNGFNSIVGFLNSGLAALLAGIRVLTRRDQTSLERQQAKVDALNYKLGNAVNRTAVFHHESNGNHEHHQHHDDHGHGD